MKKRSALAIFMVFVLCLSIMLTGCSKESKSNKDDVNEPVVTTEPELTADLAIDNTVDVLCGSNRSVIGILKDMQEKKVITASMDGVFNNVLKLDMKNSAFYNELSMTVEGETVTGKVYCNGKDLAVTSPEILGPGISVGINFSTLEEDLKASGLLDLLLDGLNMDPSTLEELLSQIQQRDEAMEALRQEFLTALEGITQDIQYSKDEGTATVYGSEVNAVIFTYSMDKDAFKKLIDLYLDTAEKAYKIQMDTIDNISGEGLDLSDPYKEAREAVEAVWDDAEMSGDVKFYANPENGCIMLTEIAYTGTVDGETLDASMTLTLGEDPATSGKYVLALDMLGDGEQLLNTEMTLTNTTEGSVDTTKLVLTAEVEDEKTEVSFTSAYDSDTTGYVLTMAANGTEIAAKGTMENTADALVITLDTLEGEGEGEELSLGITFSVENDPSCEIPPVPEYANVLTDLGLADMLEAQLYAGGSYADDNFYNSFASGSEYFEY